MKINSNELKFFFDPHPGFAGAMIPIPDKVRIVAEKLTGKIISLEDAVAQIQAATDGKVTVMNGWIALELHEANGTTHMFRVIRFK